MSINELHKLVQSGDKEAENRLFKILSDSFLIFAQHRLYDRADVEEIVQETLMTITAKYKEIEFETSFSAWAYKVLENKLMSFHRTSRSREDKIQQLTEKKKDSFNLTPNPTLQLKLKECLHSISKYNSRYARIINLSYHGYETNEICNKLKIQPGYVYNLLSRARQLLRKCLEKGDIHR
ncbi:MAG: sigma-70 family RNA polymerase sigma factor [candidate division Zixibacteria bacterium]|nr:sigma-70 family RNA polymerase sigma factor [candidate division Zixibacteria bacterium]